MTLPYRRLGGLALACALTIQVSAAPAVGVLLKGRSQFWSAMEKGALEAAQQEGIETTSKLPLSESDISVQVQLLNAMVAQGVQAVVISPSSKDALAAPIANAIAKGVKVVVVDSPINGAMPVFVSTNHEAAGAVAGKLLAGLVTDADEVTILKHSQTSVATTLREVSAYNALREAHPRLTVHRDIYSGAETGLELEKARLVLSQHPNTNAVLCSGTSGTMAMLKVLQEQNRAGAVKLVGFGFNLNSEVAAALESGAMHVWIAQVPKEIGAKAVATAAALLRGETVPEKIDCDFVVVTKANLNDPKVQALLD